MKQHHRAHREPQSTQRNFLRGSVWILCALCYALVYGARLGEPPAKYYDEVYQVTTAQQFTTLSGYQEKVHPPFGMLLMAGSIRLFGDHPVAWRVVSLACGFAILVLVFALTHALTGNRRLALIAAGLMSLDGLAFTKARIGMISAPMVCLMLASAWCLARYALEGVWSRRKALIGCGLCFGLAMATRWPAAGILPVLALLLWSAKRREGRQHVGGWWRDVFLYIGVVSVAVYFSTYLIVPFLKGYSGSSIWTLQGEMLRYHLTLACDHRYASVWWTWPLLLRPIWFVFEMTPIADPVVGEKIVRGLLCLGNPAIFWVFPVALGYAVWMWRRGPSVIHQVAVIGFMSQWLPWAVVARPRYFHYYYPAMPFVVMAVALGLERLWRLGEEGRVLVAGYLALVVVMFVWWYPLWTAWPIPESQFWQRMWLRSWI